MFGLIGVVSNYRVIHSENIVLHLLVKGPATINCGRIGNTFANQSRLIPWEMTHPFILLFCAVHLAFPTVGNQDTDNDCKENEWLILTRIDNNQWEQYDEYQKQYEFFVYRHCVFVSKEKKKKKI